MAYYNKINMNTFVSSILHNYRTLSALYQK